MKSKFAIMLLLVAPMVVSGCSLLKFAGPFAPNDEKKKEKQLASASEAQIADLPEVPADKILNAGVRNLNIGDAKKAQKAFGEIEKQHPFSQEAQRSLVLSAYTHFEEGEYDETVSKANRFLQLYPGNKDAAYMQYLIGESYHRRVSAVTLDQSDTEKGLNAYKNVVRLYPESKYVEDSKLKIIFMSDQLAGKEMQIGRYYQERGQHLGAVNRFKYVVENYQNTRHVEEALYRLTESFLALGVVSEAKTAAALLGYNYPDSQWYADAYTLLTGNNLKPEISRTSKLVKLVPFVGGDKKKKIQQVQQSAPPKPKKEGRKGLRRFVPFVGDKKPENI